MVSLEDHGRSCRQVRIALGAVAATPIRAYAAEEMLRGRPITPELIEAAAQKAQDRATPIDDIRSSASHRKAVIGVLTKRTLERAVEMARQGSLPFSLQRSLAVQAAF